MNRAFVGLVVVVISAAGCSSFHGDWRRAAGQPIPVNSIAGPWEGTWTSAGGHTGELRCIVEPLAEGQYRARFDATYWGIFRSGYVVTMKGQAKENQSVLSGEENLGWLCGGVFHYDARVTPVEFKSTYESKYDHGTFQMGRPK